MSHRRWLYGLHIAIILLVLVAPAARAQDDPRILGPRELARVVPSGFYFEGQSAPTQMRNAAAAAYTGGRHLIAGMVDTSGYSSEVRAKYEGFFIVDFPVRVGGQELGVGAYGFGFAEGRFNLFDLGGTRILSVETERDRALRRPRPLMMTVAGGAVRLYSGRDYVVISKR